MVEEPEGETVREIHGAVSGTAPGAGAENEPPERVIGPYRLIERVGTGGMGEVWLAEQESPVRRRVALKLIRAGLDSEHVMARFEAERQALALMEHPAIARVFDAGATPAGRPYFVMEFVKGEPITNWCDARRLGSEDRLRLFMLVCDGVQHAHQKGIIHRDLKPSNLLVTVQDGRPVPKIIDFGIAKATQERLTERTMFTQLGALIGTPEYMSPEQADSSVLDVDTRTDVYSLGVVLYELLTGLLPFDSRELRSAGFDEIRRRIREVDPPRPSARVSTLREGAGSLASDRDLDPGRLVRRLRGDLDWITMKALEKDRERRYATPSELAADIGRHLEDNPVEAGPPGAGYRAGKFVRRHRLGVGVATFAAVALVAFGVAMAVQARRIASERDRAAQVTRFLTDLFAVSAPSESRGSSVTAREILDKGAKRIESELSDQPLVRAELSATIGDVYRTLGLCQDASRLLRTAVEAQSAGIGPEESETIASKMRLGAALECAGEAAEAESVLKEAVAASERVHGRDDLATLQGMHLLGSVYVELGKTDEAGSVYRTILDRESKSPQRPPAKPGQIGGEKLSLAVRMDLASLEANRDPAKAVQLGRESLDRLRLEAGVDDPLYIVQLCNLASFLDAAGDLPGAILMGEDALPRTKRVMGLESPVTMDLVGDLADRYFTAGRYADSVKLYQDWVAWGTRTSGADDPEVLRRIELLAYGFKKIGRLDDAERLRTGLLDTKLRLLGGRHPEVVDLYYNVACVQALEGKRAAALDSLRQSVTRGFRDADGMLGDTDLVSLHGDKRFVELVAQARKNAAAAAAAP